MNSKESVTEGRKNRQTELNSYDPSSKQGFKNRLVNRNTTPAVWKKTKGCPKFKLISNFFILIIIIFIWIVYTVNSFRSDAAICKCSIEKLSLTLTVPCISESCIEIKIKLNCYFHTPLWCLKRFYEGLKAFIKPSEAPQRIVKIKFNSFFSFRPAWDGKG